MDHLAYFAVQLVVVAALSALLVFFLVIIIDLSYDLATGDGRGEPGADPGGASARATFAARPATGDLPAKNIPSTTPAVAER